MKTCWPFQAWPIISATCGQRGSHWKATKETTLSFENCNWQLTEARTTPWASEVTVQPFQSTWKAARSLLASTSHTRSTQSDSLSLLRMECQTCGSNANRWVQQTIKQLDSLWGPWMKDAGFKFSWAALTYTKLTTYLPMLSEFSSFCTAVQCTSLWKLEIIFTK